MDKDNINMKDLKQFEILVSFNDSTYLRGTVMAENDSRAYKIFVAAPEMVEALKVPNRKLLQYTISECVNS